MGKVVSPWVIEQAKLYPGDGMVILYGDDGGSIGKRVCDSCWRLYFKSYLAKPAPFLRQTDYCTNCGALRAQGGKKCDSR